MQPESTSTTLPPEIPSDAVRGHHAAPHADIGMVLGSYRVLDVIGEGGMGMVYLAEHIRLGRKVAIKRLKDRLAAKPEAVKQFFEEARAVNRINHPHIVDITDFVVEENAAYYLMEYLQGGTLADLLRQEKVLTPRRAVHIVSQVCGALEAAHGAGFVHLDIKPSNIFLIDKNDDPDTVKLLDFGTAQLTETQPRMNEDRNRKSGMFSLGTPVYMSPEQATGDEVDPRSDIYSLGAVLYEVLTGEPPFVAQSAPEYIYKHMSVIPKRVTQVKGLPYKIPRHCARAVMACLEKEPDNRPDSARTLSDMLQRGNTITEGQMAPGVVAAANVGGKGRRWPVIAMAAGALAAVVVGGVLLLGLDRNRADHLRPAGLGAASERALLTVRREEAKPKHVMVLIKTRPSMAQVNLLSPDRRPLGMTPLLYKTKRSDARWKVFITAEGHHPQTIEFTPDRALTFELTLKKLPTTPEAVMKDQQKSAEEERVAKAKMAEPKRTQKKSDRRAKRIKRSKRSKSDVKPATMKRRVNMNSVRTIDPFE
jgi:eukaryotic-like serine/threonine-protein kinase